MANYILDTPVTYKPDLSRIILEQFFLLPTEGHFLLPTEGHLSLSTMRHVGMKEMRFVARNT